MTDELNGFEYKLVPHIFKGEILTISRPVLLKIPANKSLYRFFNIPATTDEKILNVEGATTNSLT